MNKTLSTLALLGLLATVPAASASAADDTVNVNTPFDALAVNAATCEIVQIQSDPVAVNSATTEIHWRLFTISCPPGGGIPGGCTLTFVFGLVGSTGPLVSYVYNTPIGAISVAGLVGAAGASGGQALGATLTFIGCI